MRVMLGDRRGRQRLEIVGTVRAGLDVTNKARVVNIGPGGALIESRTPALVNSVHTVSLMLNGERVRVDARVRHLAPIAERCPEDGYRIGLEFINIPEGFPLA